jgi:hypothetical protein
MDDRETNLHRINVGSHVDIELVDVDGVSERMAFDIVLDKAADLQQGRLGENTPLARALMGQVAGNEMAYTQGDIQRVRILRVSEARTGDPAVAAEERQTVLKKALEEAERTNAAMFASSFSGKWGDYDPGGVEKWTEQSGL